MAPADHSAASSSGCKRGVPADELVQLSPYCAKRAKSKEHAEIAALRRENEELKAALLEKQTNSDALRGKLMQLESEKTRIFKHFDETLTAMGKLLGEKEMLYDQLNEQKALNQHTENELQVAVQVLQGQKQALQVAVQVLQGQKQTVCGKIESQGAVLLQNHQVHYNLGWQIHQLTQELEAREQVLMVYQHLLIDDDDEEAPAAAPSETVDQVPNASPPSSSSASGC